MGIISPIYKRGKKEEIIGEYRYYAQSIKYTLACLIKGLKKEVERKLEEGQFGFRERRGTIDAIYVLNYVANRELSKKKGKLYTCFVDLKKQQSTG